MNTTGDTLDIYGRITNNDAMKRGGAVAMQNGTLHTVNMYEGALIDGNTTGEESAGGVLVAKGVFTMFGGTISNNVADREAGAWGGGVYIRESGTFIMKDGVITGNSATTAGGGIAFDADKKNTGSYAILEGGKIEGNVRADGISDDIAVTYEKKNSNEIANASQYLVIGSEVTVGKTSVYYDRFGFSVEGPRGMKQGNASPKSITSLNTASNGYGWGTVLAAMWKDGSASDLTFTDVAIEDTLPVYLIAMASDVSGNAIADTQRAYATTVTDGVIQASVPAMGGETGMVLALVQPTDNIGAVELSLPASLTKRSILEEYVIPYDANLTISESLLNEMKTNGTGSASVSIVLDNRLAANEDVVVESALFDASVSCEGNKVTLALSLKDGWNALTGDQKVVITGTATLAQDDYTVGDNLVCEIAAVADARLIPGNITKTYMDDEAKYTVTFLDDDEETVISVKSDYIEGDTVVMPVSNPSKDGFRFTGWTPEVVETVTEDATYVAVYKELFNVSYEAEEDETYGAPEDVQYPSQMTVLEGSSLNVSEAPKTDWTTDNGEEDGLPGTWLFSGWTSENVEVDEDGSYTVTENVVFKGSWSFTPNTYKLTIHYVYADGSKAAEDYTTALAAKATYSVNSAAIAGYTVDKATVSGTMEAKDVEITVTYTAIPVESKPVEESSKPTDESSNPEEESSTTPPVRPVQPETSVEAAVKEESSTTTPATTPEKPADPNKPDTGDRSIPALWGMMMLISLAGALFVMKYGKAKKYNG